MTDLERLFNHLVATLAATNPARLEGPLSIADIQFGVIPYRTHRRALAIDSSEDYEALLLRLFAGEDGLAQTEPPEVQARLGQEARNPNPELRLLREHGEAMVSLSRPAVQHALSASPHDTSPHDGYAPAPPAGEAADSAMLEPVPMETLAPGTPHTAQPVDLRLEAEHTLELELPGHAESLPLDAVRTTAPTAAGAAATGAMCLYCGGSLPAGRQVNFCPHCGESQTTVRCPECQSEVELGWRHCINCGAAVGDG